jgi:hypothetical protein
MSTIPPRADPPLPRVHVEDVPFPEVAGSFSSIISSLRVSNLGAVPRKVGTLVARSEIPDLAGDYFQGAPYPAIVVYRRCEHMSRWSAVLG